MDFFNGHKLEKDRQCKGQKKKEKNDKQSIKHYKESEHKLHKHKGKPRCFRRVSNSRSTSSTHRVMLIKNLIVSHE